MTGTLTTGEAHTMNCGDDIQASKVGLEVLYRMVKVIAPSTVTRVLSISQEHHYSPADIPVWKHDNKVDAVIRCHISTWTHIYYFANNTRKYTIHRLLMYIMLACVNHFVRVFVSTLGLYVFYTTVWVLMVMVATTTTKMMMMMMMMMMMTTAHQGILVQYEHV